MSNKLRCPTSLLPRQRVKVVLEEKKLPYETILVDLPKAGTERTEISETGLTWRNVPVLIDSETVLYESRIINEYLEVQVPEWSI